MTSGLDRNDRRVDDVDIRGAVDLEVGVDHTTDILRG